MAEPLLALGAIGLLPDAEIDPAPAALQLARLDADDAEWSAASAHLSELAREAAAIGDALRDHRLASRVGALAGLLHARHGYRGDQLTYDDLDNANLIRVIERRKGLPVALGVLWLHCIRAAGWSGWGVDFPGHFLLALAPDGSDRDEPAEGDADRTPLLVDPFNNGTVLDASGLRAVLNRGESGDLPLQPGMVRPMATRDVLLRLQRNLLQRRLLAGAVPDGLRALEGMLQIAPDLAPNWLLGADLNVRLHRTDDAIACLERFLELVPEGRVADQARRRIEELRR